MEIQVFDHWTIHPIEVNGRRSTYIVGSVNGKRTVLRKIKNVHPLLDFLFVDGNGDNDYVIYELGNPSLDYSRRFPNAREVFLRTLRNKVCPTTIKQKV